MYDIIIVGAGPAGLTAAIYACRAKKSVLVLEANSYGGQIVNTSDIENYPCEEHISGFDFATKLYNQTMNLGASIKFEKVVEIKDGSFKEVITTKNSYKCRAIILATGAENRKLGLPNEDELVGRGVSYCATCDGSFYKGLDVAVVGGGNSAIEDALYLSDICRTVYLIHRRDSFKAEESLVERLSEKKNIRCIFNSSITRISGSDKLTGIEVNGEEISVSGLFIAVGRVPENQNFAKVVNLNDLGYVIAGEDCHTNVNGIFVAGDNRTKLLRQLVTATGDGAVAATEAIKYINKQ
jgi:thioredoxin reductase (NADPH)